MGVVLRHNHMFDMEVEPCSLLVGVDAYSTPDREDYVALRISSGLIYLLEGS